MTLYLTGAKNPAVIPLLDAGRVGLLDTPANSYAKEPGWVVAYDNGCFNSRTYVGDDAWWAWLAGQDHQGTVLFATAPDVVADATATLARSAPWLPRIRALGYPAALVAQDGLELLDVPWDTFDVLFIGGSTPWKLGPHAHALALRARDRGKRVHLGRCNSLRRLRHASAIGCHTADGTFLAFGPDVNTRRLSRWIDHLEEHPHLPIAEGSHP